MTSRLPTLPSGLSDVDVALARLVHRLWPGDELLPRTAALVSHERGLGHVCVHLSEQAGLLAEARDELQPEAEARSFRWPEVAEWRRRLLASGVAVTGNSELLAPLVLDEADRLYLTRYYWAEKGLAQGLAACAKEASDVPPDPSSRALRTSLFAPDDPRVTDQARAAEAALRGGLTLISGGPGTGKTTTVTRILLLLLSSRPDLRIALAAPTGKASARLGESIAASLDDLTHQPELEATLSQAAPEALDRIPRTARTLHRLLGYRPRYDRFIHRSENPLPCDLVVVDEASMVDLLLMSALVDALPDGASLLLLGDRDQLTSVEAGFVFGDLAEAAKSSGEERCDPDVESIGSLVELRHSWRFARRIGIGDLAEAVRRGDATEALRVLDDSARDDVSLSRHLGTDAILEPLKSPIEELLAAEDPSTALSKLSTFRILCATRVGPWGVERMNRVVEGWLAERGHPTEERFYPCRPILVQENDYQNGLFNGDLGLCWHQGGRTWAIFPGPDPASPRRLPLAKLPRHDTAWAMTVHKSQGSEFDRVLLVLPEDGASAGSVLSRELVYTGLTRAKRRVDLVATPEVLREALTRSGRRRSGLVDALRLEAGSRRGAGSTPD
ncbi:MAG: exodeoxyribonuclease V subunit alpha [Thermoanaerobaculia bacterium]|nr:exodeoxyribonuclease V subunit alpha [Thermoanaerobaculia bacterium]